MARPLLTIEGTALKEPSKYVGTTATLVDSGRNTQGVMVGGVIRDDVAKVEATWNYMTVAEWSRTLKLFSKKHGGKFYNDVTFFCDVTGGWETRSMYVSDRTSSGILMCDPITGVPVGYRQPKLSLIEA